MRNDRVANLFGALVLAVSSEMENSIDQDVSLSEVHSAALVTIAHHPDQSIDELRQIIKLSHSGAVRAVDRLVAGSLAVRAAGTDGRAVRLRVTQIGRRKVELILRARQASLYTFISRLSPDEKRQLENVCRKLLSGVAETPLEARRTCRLCDESICFAKGNCPVAIGLHAILEDESV
jgi:MarR family transcriptional regulator, negative regulator of the multidrug operon emrRAB